MNGVAVARQRQSGQAVAAAVALDRVSKSRYGEALAEVQVGDEVVDVRRLGRPARRTPARKAA